MKRNISHRKLYIVLCLFLLSIFLFISIFEERILKVAFLDVGQGDAIFIESPNGVQGLIDGGAGRETLSALSKHLPFYDKEIDFVMISNPDEDHIGGIIDIIQTFKIKKIILPGTINKSATFDTLNKIIAQNKIEKIIAERGMRLYIDKNIFFDFFFPDRNMEKIDTNTGSIITKLNFENNSILFTGDAPIGVEEYLVYLDSNKLESDILKVGHHGSKTSSSDKFLEIVKPKWAIISVGKDNKYGHPHKEALDRLGKIGAQILRTDQLGTILFKSKGDSWIKDL